MMLYSGLKGSIVSILAERFPLKASELRAELAGQGRLEVTRQAVHVALTALLEEAIVEKEGGAYQLSAAFLRRLEDFLNGVKVRYRNVGVEGVDLAPGRARRYEASSLLHLDTIWNKLIRDVLDLSPARKHAYLQRVPHAWFAIAQFEEEARVIELLAERCTGFFTVTAGSTKLDRWLARFYRGPGMRYASGVRVRKPNTQLAVLGEYVIEADYPPVTARRLDTLFEGCTQLADLDLHSFIACVNAPEPISIELTRNARRARGIERDLAACFTAIREGASGAVVR